MKACKTPFLVPDSYIIAPQELGEASKFVKVVMLLLMLMHKSGFALSEEFRSVSQEEGETTAASTESTPPATTQKSTEPTTVSGQPESPANANPSSPVKNTVKPNTNPTNTASSSASSSAHSQNTSHTSTQGPNPSIPPTSVTNPLGSSKPTIASIRTSMSSPGVSGRSSSFRKAPASPYTQSPSSSPSTTSDILSVSPQSSSFGVLGLTKSKVGGSSTSSVKLDPASVLRSYFRGEVITPSQPEYEISRSLHNRLYSQLPHFVVQPRCANDVATALKFASSNGIKVTSKKNSNPKILINHFCRFLLSLVAMGLLVERYSQIRC